MFPKNSIPEDFSVPRKRRIAVCLFGVPDPVATEHMYQEVILDEDNRVRLAKYNIDLLAEEHSTPDVGLRRETIQAIQANLLRERELRVKGRGEEREDEREHKIRVNQLQDLGWVREDRMKMAGQEAEGVERIRADLLDLGWLLEDRRRMAGLGEEQGDCNRQLGEKRISECEEVATKVQKRCESCHGIRTGRVHRASQPNTQMKITDYLPKVKGSARVSRRPGCCSHSRTDAAGHH